MRCRKCRRHKCLCRPRPANVAVTLASLVGPAAQGLITALGPEGVTALLEALGVSAVAALVGGIGPTGVARLVDAVSLPTTIALTGAVGPAGVAGLVGAIGPQGVAGLVGAIGVEGIAGIVGQTGTQGIAGAVGLAGVQGIQGIAGLAGEIGPQGVAGIVGEQGTIGLTGAIGLPGLPGAIGVGEYAYIYNVSAETVAVNDDVDFDLNGPITPGITHAPGSTTIGVATAGVYEITWSASGVEPNQFALVVNGAPLLSSLYGSGAGTQQNNGQVIVDLPAGSTLSLRNLLSAAAVTLQTLAGGTQPNVNASILIRQLA